jgi:transcription elongation factor Elf1
MPSIDCVLARARLRYFARILRNQPPTLLALLGARPRGKPLPWVALVIDDLSRLRRLVATCAALPCPREHPDAWLSFTLESAARWAQAISVFHYDDSVCDHVALPGMVLLHEFSCPSCPARFESSRAMLSHSRRKHGTRILQRAFAEANATCQSCGTQFDTRVRLIRHLCDTRRTRCWDAILESPASFRTLSGDALMALDRADTVSRRDAQRAGHSHPIAVGPARTAAGRIIGHAQR